MSHLARHAIGKAAFDSMNYSGFLRFIAFLWLLTCSSLAQSSAPTVTTTAATAVTDISATINGTVTPNTSDTLALYFDYGLTTAYDNTCSAYGVSPTGSQPVPEYAPLTGLQPNTTYHYRFYCYDDNTGEFTYGSDLSFTTGAPSSPPKFLFGAYSYGIGAVQASIAASLQSAGGADTTISFDYGLTSAYGHTVTCTPAIPAATLDASFYTVLTGLTPSTTYHFRCTATSSLGVAHTADQTFTTAAPPSISTGSAISITDMSATLTGTANAAGGHLNISFDIGTTTNYGSWVNTDISSVYDSTPVAESAVVTGLLPNTTYHFRFKGTDDAGTEYNGNDATFTTAPPSTPSTIGNVWLAGTQPTQATIGVDSVTAGSSPTTFEIEYGTSTSYGQTATYPYPLALGTSTNGTVYIPIPGLTPATTYHFRGAATNGQGTVTSPDQIFTTPPAPIVTTAPASGITDLSATMNGTVNPNGDSLNLTFEYGTTTVYGSNGYISYPNNYLSGNTTTPVSVALTTLLPNTTYHYRLKGYDQTNTYYYAADATFTTNAAATPPTVGAVTASYATASSVQVTVANICAGSSTATASFQYGLTTSYGSSTTLATTFPLNSSSSQQSTRITGLQPNTTYHYRCLVANSEGATASADGIFTTLPAPVITTDAATAITDTTATLNGAINPQGGSLSVYFDYGTTSNYGNSISPTSSTTTGNASVGMTAKVSGLLPSTTYHCRFTGYDSSGTSYYGADTVFTTSMAATPPTLGTVSLSSITATTASLNISSASAGSSSAMAAVEYGPTSSYGSSVTYSSIITTNTSVSNISIPIKNLTPGTTYHYRCSAMNDQGIARSPDNTFTTLLPPTVTTNTATGVTDLTATINGTANPNGGSLTVYFEYGTTTNYSTTAYPASYNISGTSVTSFSVAATALSPNTTYHYRLTTYDAGGTYYRGNDATFTTAQPATPPTVTTGTPSSIYAKSATARATVTTGSSTTTLLFDYGLTTDYGNQITSPSSLSANLTNASVTATISGLAPSTAYHYRARASNNEGTFLGSDQTFTTLPLPTVATATATAVTDLTATFNGSANAQSGSYGVSFQYGLTPTYGSSIQASPSSLSGTGTSAPTAKPLLLPNTTYHYRLILNDGVTSFYGGDQTLTTLTAATPPSITTASASAISATTAYLNASALKTGSSPATAWFNYGTSSAYGLLTPSTTVDTNHAYSSVSVALTGLQPSTTYHFAAAASNAQGSASGTDMSFTTMALPALATGAATNVTDLTATLNATVNPGGVACTATFEYGSTTTYGSVVNASPNMLTGTTATSVSAVLPLRTPSSTYHYRIRVDSVDGTYYGADNTFSTSAPATAPTLGTVSAGTPGAFAANITLSSLVTGSSTATLIFEYGLTATYGSQVVYSSALPPSRYYSPGVSLTGLTPGTTYHLRARAFNNEGTSATPDVTFTTAGAPALSTGAATDVTQSSAILNGTLNANDGSLTVYFEYGTTTNYTYSRNATPYSITGNYTVAANVSVSLNPGTTYHYRIKATDAVATYYGSDQTFSTASSSIPLSVTTDSASVTATTATLSASSISTGNADSTVSWQYGFDSTYGSSITYGYLISAGTTGNSAASTITGLPLGTTYHYRAVISNTQGTAYGADATFTTAPISLAATTSSATQVTTTGALLNGSFFSNISGSTVTFDYGPDTNYGLSIAATPSTAAESNSSHTITAALSGLASGTTYHYRVANTNPYGTVYGSDKSFTTAVQTNTPIVTTGTATGSTTGTATFRGLVNANGLPTSCAIEYGPTANYGSILITSPSSITGNSILPVTATVGGLVANGTYYYRVIASNSAGTAYGTGASVQMVQPPTATTNLIVWYGPQTVNLIGTVTSNTSVTASFDFGTTTSYGSSFTAEAISGSLAFRRIGVPYTTALQPNTTYHYRIVATNAGGTTYGSDVSFTTDFDLPTTSYQPITGLTSTTATLNATVNEVGGTDAISFDYGGTTAYGGNVTATPASVSGNGAFPVAIALTGLTPGTTYHYRLNTSRSALGSVGLLHAGDQTFTTLTAAQNWRQQYFNTTEAVGLAANDASPFGDGICNLLKYAFGLDPTVPFGALPQPHVKTYDGTNYLSLTFPRNPLNTDLVYEVIAADSPDGPWNTIASSIAGTPTAGPGFVAESTGENGLINVEVHDTVSSSLAPKRFLRLRITGQ